MLKFTLLFTIFYVIRSSGQQQPDAPIVDGFEMFNMDLQEDESLVRSKRNIYWANYICGETTLISNMSLPMIYGKWYPVRMSKKTYELWVTSLYGEDANDDVICPVWNFKPSTQMSTLNIEVSHGKKSIRMEALLLGEEVKAATSKWVLIGPNGEETLTSVRGLVRSSANYRSYDWLLTMECDLSGVPTSDWAFYSRLPIMSPDDLDDYMAYVHSIKALQTTEITEITGSCTN